MPLWWQEFLILGYQEARKEDTMDQCISIQPGARLSLLSICPYQLLSHQTTSPLSVY